MSIFDTAAAKLAAAKTAQEAEAICAEHEQACAAEVAQLEAAIVSERALQHAFLKTRALRATLFGKIKPRMLDAAMALLTDTFDLQVTDDQRVVVRSDFGDQPVDLAVAGWLVGPQGAPFAGSSSLANARGPGPFEELAKRILH